MTIKLLAPAGVTVASGRSGTVYNVDNGGEITVSNYADISGLLNGGFTYPGASNNGKNNFTATTAPGVTNDNTQDYAVGSLWVNTSSGLAYMCTSAATGAAVWNLLGADNVANPVNGVAANYKVARGIHQQAAASDTIVTGLTTVVSVVACWRDKPTLKQLYVAASIGDQAGSPAAGSILINTYKATAANDCTPGTPTDFTDNLNIDWIAIGT